MSYEEKKVDTGKCFIYAHAYADAHYAHMFLDGNLNVSAIKATLDEVHVRPERPGQIITKI